MSTYELATPQSGTVLHIVRATPSAYYGLDNRMTWQRALCGVSGANGGWPSTMAREDVWKETRTPVAEATCRKCMKLWKEVTA